MNGRQRIFLLSLVFSYCFSHIRMYYEGMKIHAMTGGGTVDKSNDTVQKLQE